MHIFHSNAQRRVATYQSVQKATDAMSIAIVVKSVKDQSKRKVITVRTTNIDVIWGSMGTVGPHAVIEFRKKAWVVSSVKRNIHAVSLMVAIHLLGTVNYAKIT